MPTRLELTWPGKDDSPKLEPRILLEQPEYSYHAAHRVTENDIFDNFLIKGDNLLALKSLATDPRFQGKVKCIYIDPPYNTGNAFEHYDDGIEHSLWLSMMKHRLELLWELLSPEGSIWITLDDNEVHYCKVICDEIFGRNNFLGGIVWQSKDTPGNNSTGIAQTHNHILSFAKSAAFKPNLLLREEKQLATYKNPDNDKRGPWLATPLTRAEFRERDYYPIKNKVGDDVYPPKGSSWRRPPDKLAELLEDDRVWWGANGDSQFPMEKKFLSEVKEGVVNQTWWPYDFAGSTRNASAELKSIFGSKTFDTPKPEKLIYRVLNLATGPGDLILDSFLGSGTTVAVAHKMGRRWIGIELGEHAYTHCYPRLKAVVEGADQGGISRAVGWQGGGGFRFFTLAPSLLEKDRFGNEVISKQYNSAMLAEALCKLESFSYAPSQDVYWQHGFSTERDFIYCTTQTLSYEQLAHLSEEVGPDRSLLILCAAYRGNVDDFPNLTVKKIPQAIRKQCEWGKDDYSLKVENLTKAQPKPGTNLTIDFGGGFANEPENAYNGAEVVNEKGEANA